MVCKLLNRVKGTYVNGLEIPRRSFFLTDNNLRRICVISPRLFIEWLDGLMKEENWYSENGSKTFREAERKEIAWPLYVYDLVLCGDEICYSSTQKKGSEGKCYNKCKKRVVGGEEGPA